MKKFLLGVLLISFIFMVSGAILPVSAAMCKPIADRRMPTGNCFNEEGGVDCSCLHAPCTCQRVPVGNADFTCDCLPTFDNVRVHTDARTPAAPGRTRTGTSSETP